MTQKTRKLPSGAVLQSAIPSRNLPADSNRAYGLKLRGVVTATYVLDDPSHPAASGEPVTVYCDVMTYAGPSWMPRAFFPKCLVTQELGGMHRGRLWRPRAATIDVSSTDRDLTGPGVNPANLDGDHVLLGFLNDSLSQPIIERGIPHPNADTGFDPNTENEIRGHLKLRLADGDPDIHKHAGTFYGIQPTGEYVVSTCYAYGDREIDERGNEPGPADDGEGSVRFVLPDGAEYNVLIIDRSQLPALAMMAGLEIAKNGMQFSSTDAAVIFSVVQEGVPGDNVVIAARRSGASAECKIGDGAVHAAQVEKLQQLYTQLKIAHDTHKHPDATGGTGIADVAAPNWDNGINSTKVSFPDG